MPLLKQCAEVQPGMTLGEPFIFEGRVLLRPGRTLSAGDVDTLHDRCPDELVCIADDRLDGAAEFESNFEDRGVAQTVCHKLRSLLGGVYHRFESSEHPQVSEKDIDRVRGEIANVMQHLRRYRISSLQLPACISPATFLTDHLANVVYTSLVFGNSIRSYVTTERQRLSGAPLRPNHLRDLTSLALGAAFLDIGMAPLRQMYENTDVLNSAQRAAVRNHCVAGIELMPENFSPLARMIIRSHHESADGSGYPAGIYGAKLHVFQRITHIADAFNACMSRQVFPDAGSIVSTAWRMSQHAEQCGDDAFLMLIFLDLIRPFPIGARVQLTDGRGAIVVRRERGRPFHPVLLIAFDDQDKPIDPPIGPIALATEAELGIRSIDGEDLGFMYGHPDCLAPPPLAADSLLGALYGPPEMAEVSRPVRY